MSEPDSRAASQLSGPTIMSAPGSKTAFYSTVSMRPSQALPFKSALDVDIVYPKKGSTGRVTSAPHTCCGKIQHRYVFALMASTGLAITYGLKVNFHVCIVAMINHTALLQNSPNKSFHKDEGTCHPNHDENGTDIVDGHHMEGPFDWNHTIQGILLSSYFYGYLATQLIGGRLAEVFSAKWTFGVSLFFNSILTVLTPMAAFSGWGALLAVRILEGCMGGVTLPSTHVMLSKWAPPSEVSRLSSAVYAGLSLGTVLSVSSTGLTAEAHRWQTVFYSQGGLAMLFVIAWFGIIHDSPAFHPYISNQEKYFIMDSTGHEHHHNPSPSVPWKAILTSRPFWAVLISHTGSNFGWYMILTELPTYMSSILGFDLKSNALLSALPFLVMWVYSIFFGAWIDHLVHRNLINRTQATKLSTAVAAYVPAVSMIIVSYIGCDKMAAVGLLTLCTGTFGSMYSGFLSNHIQIAPVFAGTLMAITNTVATVSGVVVPNFVGALIDGNNTIAQWRIIFITTAVVLVLHATQYCLLASGEEQEWSARAHSDSESESEHE